MVLNELGPLASISGLGIALSEWFRTRAQQQDQSKADEARATIAEFRAWLNWKNQRDILQQLESSDESLQVVTQLIEELMVRSEDHCESILDRLKETDIGGQVEDRSINIGRDMRGGVAVSGDGNVVINLLSALANASADDREFEREYLQRVRKEYERLRVLGVSEMRNIRQKLSIAYVSLNTKRQAAAARRQRRAEDIESRRAEEVLLMEPLLAIRGPVGSGKTTLLHWIALRCASDDETDAKAWKDGIPFFIPLRRLDEAGEGQPRLERFTEYTIDPKIWQARPPEGWLDRVLDQGRAVLLLDGVDELPQTVCPKFWEWLEKFAEQYPGNRVYVSSRPFPEQKREKLWNPPPAFASTDLDEMSDQDICEFIDSWHHAVRVQENDEYDRRDLEEKRDRLPERLAEPRNRAVRELCRTPLLCALVCAVHWRDEGYLPGSRIELYDNCCRMLLELRDVKRDIKRQTGPLAALTLDDKEMILRRLALKMMRDRAVAHSRLQIEIGREDAEKWVALSIPSCGSDEARKCQPGEVIDLLIERSGLLREPAKDRLDFPHRTFQEYLAACGAGEENEPGDVAARAQDDQWRDTILLAAGTKVGGAPYGNALVQRLVELGEAETENKAKRHSFFALAVGCLETGRANIGREVRDRVLGHLQEITPPRSFEEARILSACGEVVLEYLQFARWTKTLWQSAEVAAACVRTLALIGSEQAIAMLIDPKGYGNDDRETVQREICKCPNLDPMQVPAICQSLGRRSGPPWFVRPLITRITPDISDHLPSPSSLDIRNCTGLLELSLPEFPALCSLNLSGCTALPKLRLPKLPTLSSLDLSGSTDLKELSLPELPKLLYLNLDGCTGLAELSLPELPTLGWLYRGGCSGLTELSLPELPKLRYLNLTGCTGLTELSLPELPNLSSLDVSGCTGLPGLPELPNLSSLDVSGCTGLPGLPELPNLSSLDVSGCTGLTGLPNLSSLDVSGCTGLTELPELPNMSRLDLSDCTGLTELSLTEMPNLTRLNLSGCTGLTELSLPELLNLTRLDLSGCTGLTELSLTKLPKLRILILSDCSGLTKHLVRNVPEDARLVW